MHRLTENKQSEVTQFWQRCLDKSYWIYNIADPTCNFCERGEGKFCESFEHLKARNCWQSGFFKNATRLEKFPFLIFILADSLEQAYFLKVWFLRPPLLTFALFFCRLKKGKVLHRKISGRLASCSCCHFLTWSWFLFSKSPPSPILKIFPFLTILIFLLRAWNLSYL